MTNEKYNFYSKKPQLMSQEDLRVIRIFWFALGFLTAAVLTLILFTSVK